MFDSYLKESILKKAIENKLIFVHTYALRDFTHDKHRRVDGRAYGGGPGMVMWVDPIIQAIDTIKKEIASRETGIKSKKKIKVILFSPGGEMFSNAIAKKVSQQYTDIIFICGRYEGVDARVKKIVKATEWSVGDYVLTGGELPALTCIDVMSRQIEGVLHDENSLEDNRIASHEIYARPELYEYNGKKYKVPKVLLSGNHKLIDEYRMKKQNTIGKQE